MSKRQMSRAELCDLDCFACQHPDCIREDLTAEDYARARALEGFIHPPTPKQAAIAAKQKAYREENREAIAAKQKAYREENREATAAKQKAYYEENRETIAAKNGRILYDLRHLHGMSQAALGRVLGVGQRAVSYWETGSVPFDLDRILEKTGWREAELDG